MPNHAMLLRLDLFNTRTTIRISSPKTSQEKLIYSAGLPFYTGSYQERNLASCRTARQIWSSCCCCLCCMQISRGQQAQLRKISYTCTSPPPQQAKISTNQLATASHLNTQLQDCHRAVTIAQQHSKLRRCETASMQSSNASSCLSY